MNFLRLVNSLTTPALTYRHDDRRMGELVRILLVITTVAAGAIVILSFQPWIDFGSADTSGLEADAATGLSDGWFVAGFGSAILVFIGAVLFRGQLSPILLPAIAAAAIAVLCIAGFDVVTNWQASDIFVNHAGAVEEAQGDPTIVPYAISGLAILIALSAAIIRGLQIREDSKSPYEANLDRDVSGSMD